MADDQVSVQQIVPGPCPPEGCPEPTEIVCIEVNKVYDFCFQTERQSATFTVPKTVTMGQVGEAVPCMVDVANTTCMELVALRQPLPGGFANVTLSITVPIILGTPPNTVTETITFMKTVTICAPEGTTVDCRIAAARCECVITAIQNHERVVNCNVDLCIIVESRALVKLLVPSFGFCVPAPCVTFPLPPFVCPPEDLFPPQCVPVDNGNADS
ncbi:MAG TPA: hypothetical protein VF234_01890 [Limnochordia bacterium]